MNAALVERVDGEVGNGRVGSGRYCVSISSVLLG